MYVWAKYVKWFNHPQKLWQFTKLIQKFGHFGIVTPTINHHSGSPFLIFLTWHGICSSKLTFERLFFWRSNNSTWGVHPSYNWTNPTCPTKKRVPQAGMSQVDIPERRREDVKGGDPPVINSNYKVNDRHFFGDIGEFTISLLNWFFSPQEFRIFDSVKSPVCCDWCAQFCTSNSRIPCNVQRLIYIYSIIHSYIYI